MYVHASSEFSVWGGDPSRPGWPAAGAARWGADPPALVGDDPPLARPDSDFSRSHLSHTPSPARTTLHLKPAVDHDLARRLRESPRRRHAPMQAGVMQSASTSTSTSKKGKGRARSERRVSFDQSTAATEHSRPASNKQGELVPERGHVVARGAAGRTERALTHKLLRGSRHRVLDVQETSGTLRRLIESQTL